MKTVDSVPLEAGLVDDEIMRVTDALQIVIDALRDDADEVSIRAANTLHLARFALDRLRAEVVEQGVKGRGHAAE